MCVNVDVSVGARDVRSSEGWSDSWLQPTRCGGWETIQVLCKSGWYMLLTSDLLIHPFSNFLLYQASEETF